LVVNLPLLRDCPASPKAAAREAWRARRVDRGVTIGVCPECRGVWLDAGELAQLLAGAET